MARVSLLNRWLLHYLDETCSTTFLNASESAKKAGYKAKSDDAFRAIGSSNFTKVADKINSWLDTNGLSEAKLKLKLLQLIDAKETKFFAHEGKITDSVEVDAIETQRRTLDMAMKVRGMYAKDNAQKKAEVKVSQENKTEKSEDEKEQIDRLINAVDAVLMGRQ